MIDNLELKKQFFAGLNERQKRHYCAVESESLGYYGVRIVSQAFRIHPDTIRQGKKELREGDKIPDNRIRKHGGGRKKT